MKNVVFMPIVIPEDPKLSKFGGWEWMDYSKQAWQYWCDKMGYELVIYDSPSLKDTSKYRVTVQRWFDLFDFLDKKNIEYDQVAMIDACIFPHWDCPDFFQLTNNKFTVGIENDNLGWVYKGVRGYKNIFNGYNLDITKYFCSGFVIVNKSHRILLQKFKEKYMAHDEEFIKMQTETVQCGTCQTPLNYVVQMNNTDINYLPNPYRMSHLPRKDLFTFNDQLNEDPTLFFIKYGYIWQFSGFDKRIRNKLMVDVWNTIKHNYQ